jgi:hypothetical protein
MVRKRHNSVAVLDVPEGGKRQTEFSCRLLFEADDRLLPADGSYQREPGVGDVPLVIRMTELKRVSNSKRAAVLCINFCGVLPSGGCDSTTTGIGYFSLLNANTEVYLKFC